MGEGDETIMGPFRTNSAGVTAAGAEMDTAYVSKNDTYMQINAANGLEFWVIHIEAVA